MQEGKRIIRRREREKEEEEEEQKEEEQEDVIKGTRNLGHWIMKMKKWIINLL